MGDQSTPYGKTRTLSFEWDLTASKYPPIFAMIIFIFYSLWL